MGAQSLQNLSRELEARGLPGRADLVWLLDCASEINDTQLDAFATYGYGIGPEKVNLLFCQAFSFVSSMHCGVVIAKLYTLLQR